MICRLMCGVVCCCGGGVVDVMYIWVIVLFGLAVCVFTVVLSLLIAMCMFVVDVSMCDNDVVVWGCCYRGLRCCGD